MKKIILLFAISLTFLNCSSSDENVSDNSLIGTWKIAEEYSNGEKTQLRECQENDFTEIFSNNTFKATFYEKVDNECITNDDSSGTWKHIGGKEYNIIVGDKKVWLILLDNTTFKLFEDKNDVNSYEVWKLQ